MPAATGDVPLDNRPAYLVASCQWCAATISVLDVAETPLPALGLAVRAAADAGNLLYLRRSALPGVFAVGPCRCRPEAPGPIPTGD